MSPARPRLRLVTPSERTVEPPEPHDISPTSRVVYARPGDRLEPWPLRNEQLTGSFARACWRIGVRFDVAGRAVVERGLLIRDLVDAGAEDAVNDLDDLAAGSRVGRGLTDGLAAYLRTLAGGDVNRNDTYRSLSLPVRLRERLGDDEASAHLHAALIPVALNWERAAVIHGMTMTEWGALTALRRRP
jgi:hypothetical protein